jgi:hypothetical protein
MDPISLIILAVNGMRTVLNNPALGGGSSVKLDQASELLGILGVLISQGDDAIDDLKAFTATIQSMAASGRAPSRVEWDILRGRSDDAHARLQAAKEELLGEEEVDDEVPTESEPEAEPTPEPTPEPEPEVVEEDPTEEEPEPPPTG